MGRRGAQDLQLSGTEHAFVMTSLVPRHNGAFICSVKLKALLAPRFVLVLYFCPLLYTVFFVSLVFSYFLHSFIHSFIHSSIHLFNQPIIHSFIHSFIHLFNQSFIHSFIRPSFIHSSIHSFIHSFIHFYVSIRL